MNEFTRVSKDNPCPICNHTEWCQFGTRAVKCMRVESQHEASQGGWYHFYDTFTTQVFKPKVNRIETPVINAYAIWKELKEKTPNDFIVGLSACLGVSFKSLVAIGAAWSPKRNAWVFPMRDSQGNIIGLRLRNSDGFKWAESGSKSALFYREPIESDKPILPFIVEGPTDTAALLSLGLYAVGRPNCLTGLELLQGLFKRLKVYRCVIVADNDAMKIIGSKECRPGIEGAQKLKREIGIKSCIWLPPSPCKDSREFVRKGGTRQLIESMINNQVWSNK